MARAKVARGKEVNEAFWTTFAATLAGGAVSVITAWLTAEYSLRRMKVEEDRADAREERNYRRERQRELEQARSEPVLQEIAAVEAFSQAATRYYLLASELGRDAPEVVEAKLEFAKLAGSVYRYPEMADPIDMFKEDVDSHELHRVIAGVEGIVSMLRVRLVKVQNQSWDDLPEGSGE